MTSARKLCFDRVLPRDLARPHLSLSQGVGQILRAISPKNKQWPNGSTIKVGFKGGTSVQQDMVRIVAPEWCQFANLELEFTTNPGATIRVSFDPSDGAWSYIGTDNLDIPVGAATLNLGWQDRGVILHEFGHCLSGDTLIDCPRDLEKYPKGIPLRSLVGTRPWVYAWKNGQIVLRRAQRIWRTKRAKTIRVVLGTGQGGRRDRKYLPPLELVGTPEHRVLLADGKTWRNLGSLKPGDRLCSLYRQANGRRSRIRWTGSADRVREHVFVCEQIHGPRPFGHDAHHVNGRMLDQDPDNLQWKEEGAHHSDHSKGRHHTQEAKDKIATASRGRLHTDEAKKKISAAAMRRIVSDETRAKLSVASKGRPQSSELIAKRRAAMNMFYAAGGRSGMFGKNASSETRAKQSASAKAFYASGGIPGMLGKHHSKETKRKMSLANNHTVIRVEPGRSMDVFDMSVPDAESFVANGVVVHNCIGLAHEHQNPSGGIQWNEPAVIADLSGPPNYWDEDTIRHNVLDKYSMDQIIGTAFDPNSIMLYAFPAEWTKNGVSTKENSDLSTQDKTFVGSAQMYPVAGAPLPSLPVYHGMAGAISRPGEQDTYRFQVAMAGDYVIETGGASDLFLSLYGPNSPTKLIGQNDDSGAGRNARIEATLQPGTYYVQVRHYSSSGSGPYRIWVAG